jgi:hypothetical protein
MYKLIGNASRVAGFPLPSPVVVDVFTIDTAAAGFQQCGNFFDSSWKSPSK